MGQKFGGLQKSMYICNGKKYEAMTLQTMTQLKADYFKTQPVEYAYLFGSCARGEETKDSDVDILFAPEKEAFFSLLTYAHIHRELEELLHRKVDLVADGTLRPMAEASAQKDKIKIYERIRS